MHCVACLITVFFCLETEAAATLSPLRGNADARQRPLSDWLADLSEFQWVRNPFKRDDPLALAHPWHHPSVTHLVTLCNDESSHKPIVAKLREILSSGPPPAQVNAAIALAMLDVADEATLRALDRAALNDSLPTSVRVSAALLLADRPARLNARDLRTLLEGWRDLAPDSPPPDLFAAFLFALIQCNLQDAQYDPVSDALVGYAARFSDTAMLRAAAIAYAGRPWEDIPTELVKLLSSEEAAVRRTALAAMCRYPTPAAAQLCQAAVTDKDMSVRIEATRLLARFPGEQTIRLVRRLARSESAALREACVQTAAELGDVELLTNLAEDSTSRVRSAVAERSLGPAVENAFVLLKRLLDDRDPTVQTAAIRSLSRIADDDAISLLIERLSSTSLKVRSAAQESLASIWTPATDFVPTAPAPIRAETLEKLRAAWANDRGRTSKQTASDSAPERRNLRIERLLDSWLHADPQWQRQIAESLVERGLETLQACQRYFERSQTYPDREFVALVLAPLEEAYEDILALGDADDGSAMRRASRLASRWEKSGPTWLEATLAARALTRRPEPGPWLALAPALETAGESVCAMLDPHALEHSDKLVRADAWRRIAKRIRPRHAKRLQAAVNDSSEDVRLAALDAAGRAADSSVTAILVEQMRSPNPRQRLAAAGALHRLGDTRGFQELVRLSFDGNHRRRQAVVELLGETAGADRAAALRVLARAMDDPKPEVVEAAIRSLENLTDLEFSSGPFGETLPLGGQAEKWKAALAEQLATSPEAPLR